VGFPPGFGGERDVWCPEGLLAASVGSCLMTSFRHVLNLRGGVVQTYMSAVKATLAKTPKGLRITGVDVATVIGVKGAAAAATASRAARQAQTTCPISHSLSCPVSVTWQINDIMAPLTAQERSNADL